MKFVSNKFITKDGLLKYIIKNDSAKNLYKKFNSIGFDCGICYGDERYLFIILKFQRVILVKDSMAFYNTTLKYKEINKLDINKILEGNYEIQQ